MTPARVLRVGIADLLAHPGARRRLQTDAELSGLATSAADVPDGAPVHVDLTLEAIGGGSLTATGTVGASWVGACRRCLEPVEGEAEVAVKEVFEAHPTEGETYALHGEEVDLEPMVRDAVLLALPIAPLCRDGCRGPAPDDFPTGPEDESDPKPIDPRWAALSDLDLDE
jgi:uncharacterized protein